MTLRLENIIQIYNSLDLQLLNGNFLREDLYIKDLLFNKVKELFLKENPKDYFPSSRLSIPRIISKNYDQWKNTFTKLKPFLKKSLPITLNYKNNNSLCYKIISSHLIESLFALERSIFWFFNYKHNLIPGHEVASSQAQYYSQFFAVVAILKFLGNSIVHSKYGQFKIEFDWEKLEILFDNSRGSRSEHMSYLNKYISKMKEIDLSKFPEMDSKFNLTLREDNFYGLSQETLMKIFQDSSREERMENVYDLTSRFSDPFKYYQSSTSYLNNKHNYCFLDGYMKYYKPPDYYDGDYEEWFNTVFIPDYYGGWGMYEHNIGQMIQFLIENIKKISKSTNYLNLLEIKIRSFENYDEEIKDILVNWIS